MTGSNDSISEKIKKQGDVVRAMKAAIKANEGAYSMAELKDELDKLVALKAQGASSAGVQPRDDEEEKGGAASTEEISGPDDDSYRNQRWADLELFEKRGGTVYPHKFAATITVPHFLEKYAHLAAGEDAREAAEERIAGRVFSVRRAGKGLVFMDFKGDGARMQLMCDKKHFTGDWEELDVLIKRGDVVGASGIPARNKRAELCLVPSRLELLAPCVRLLPKEHFGLKDPDARFRKRHVDLLSNAHVRRIFEGDKRAYEPFPHLLTASLCIHR